MLHQHEISIYTIIRNMINRIFQTVDFNQFIGSIL
jgi:hypothetical protein